MLANYHTHTWRCQHAEGEDRAYVENAIRNGMKVLGFADHCPFVFPDDFVSPIRMTPGQVEEYFTSLTKLRDEYSKDITIYIGFESEYLPELMEAQEKLLADYPVDYMILGEHYTKREPFGRYTAGYAPSEEMLAEYVDMVIAGMETGKYIYAAHPDLMAFDNPEIFNKHYTRLCQYLKEHDIPVEINQYAIYLQRFYSTPHFLKLAADIGCKAIIGVDAHTPDFLDNRSSQAECQNRAALAGLKLMDYLPGFGPKHLK